MNSRTYYYARVSSKEQNLDRQIAAFKALGADDRDIITDKESGKDLDRKGYQALKNAMLRRGDTLVVKSLDRLSRNKSDIHNELQYFKDNGIRLKVIDLPTTTFVWNLTPIAFKLSISLSKNVLGNLKGGIPYLNTPPNLCNASAEKVAPLVCTK